MSIFQELFSGNLKGHSGGNGDTQYISKPGMYVVEVVKFASGYQKKNEMQKYFSADFKVLVAEPEGIRPCHAVGEIITKVIVPTKTRDYDEVAALITAVTTLTFPTKTNPSGTASPEALAPLFEDDGKKVLGTQIGIQVITRTVPGKDGGEERVYANVKTYEHIAPPA